MKTVRFLFNDAMARAIVEGRKTVTRRPVIGMDHHAINTRFNPGAVGVKSRCVAFDEDNRTQAYARMPCLPGDLLIGRECFRFVDFSHIDGVWSHGVKYRAGGLGPYRHGGEELMNERTGWRASAAMPDWAARIRRRVVSVTVEQVQDITEEDAVREGFPAGRHGGTNARNDFLCAWDDIYLNRGLASAVNPWVWRIEFSAENVEATP